VSREIGSNMDEPEEAQIPTSGRTGILKRGRRKSEYAEETRGKILFRIPEKNGSSASKKKSTKSITNERQKREALCE